MQFKLVYYSDTLLITSSIIIYSSVLFRSLLLEVVLLDWFEVRMVHGVLRGNSVCMIVSQHLAEQVQGLFRYQVLVC